MALMANDAFVMVTGLEQLDPVSDTLLIVLGIWHWLEVPREGNLSHDF